MSNSTMASTQSSRRFLNAIRSKKSSSIAVYVDSGCALLKGATQDAAPTTLRVRVVLDLLEPTTIKSILLSFRGDASTSSIHGRPNVVYDICNQEWSLLSSQSPLVIGTHTFPFEVTIGGSLPASTSETIAPSGVCVQYSLHAVATCRDRRRSNLCAVTPVQLMRSFPADSLEFQQSIEHEGTARGQIMYSLSIPHKTWAAGETLSAVFKASLLAKGTVIRQIRTSVSETRRTLGGDAQVTLIASNSQPIQQAGSSTGSLRHMLRSSSSKSLRRKLPSRSGHTSATSVYSKPDISALLTLSIPSTTVPSSAIEPILIEHHVCCTIDLVSATGVSSSIDCRLPVHILDHRLLPDVVAATLDSRILALGSAAGRDERGLYEREHTPPCYTAHVQDRIFYAERPSSMRIPSYEVASREVTGGLPPLDLLQQLPGYAA